MRLAFILALALASLTTPLRAWELSDGPIVQVHLGFWNYEEPLFGNGHNQSRGPYLPHRDYVVSPNGSFTGSYYVESGVTYFQPPSGSRQVIKPGSFTRVDDLATRLEYEASLACIDMNDNYRDNPGYAKTYKQAFHFYELAHDLDTSAQKSDRSAIADNQQKLGPMLDTLRKDTSGWTRHEHQQHGDLQTRLDRLASLSHHLSQDIESKTSDSTSSETAKGNVPEKSLLLRK